MSRGGIFVVALMCLTVIWGMLIGKDLGWDILNHHYYLPYAWWNGQVFTDLFAAGPQSYQNPLGYLPFYFMVSWDWPSWLIGLFFGAIHSINVYLVFRFSQCLWGGKPNSLLWSALATLMAWISPIFLALIASSSVDVISSIFVLLALLLVVFPRKTGGRRLDLFLAGFALAVAISIKLSNLIFLIALCSVLFGQLIGKRASLSSVLACGSGVAIGLLLGMGWYSWELYKHFQNPIFPLYNNIFQSPYAPVESVASARFNSGMNIWERVLEIAQMRRFSYFEGFAPDIRFLLLLVLLIVALPWALIRLVRRSAGRVTPADWESLTFFVVGFVVWLAISGNGRYVVPLCLLAGVLLARWLFILFGNKLGRVLALLLVCLQGGYSFSATEFRFTFEQWDGEPFYKIHAAPALVNQPYLHLLLGTQTNASLYAKAGFKGVMANPLGQFSFEQGTPLGARYGVLREQWRGRVRGVFSNFLDRSPADIEKGRMQVNRMIYRLGYEVDLTQCLTFDFDRAKPAPGSLYDFVQQNNMYKNAKTHQALISCALRERTHSDVEFESSRKRADQAFAIIEAACPKLYGPTGGVTEWHDQAWARYYPNTDSTVLVSEELGVTARLLRNPLDRRIGTYQEVLAGKGVYDCSRISMLTPD